MDIRNAVKLAIPNGYQVKSVPEKMSIALPDKKGFYFYEIKTLDDDLLITRLFKINSDIFYPEEYEALRKFYTMIFDKQAEKIVLTKV